MADPLSRLSVEQKTVAAKIRDTCEALGVDPNFGLAIGWAENRFRTGDNPDSGAKGPMQVMPSNAKGLGIEVSDLDNVDANIDAGCRILKENLDAFGGDSRLAAIAYNARPLVAKAYLKHQDESRLPRETQKYLTTLGSIYEIGKPAVIPTGQPSSNPFDAAATPEAVPEQVSENVFEGADASIAPEAPEEVSSGMRRDAGFGGAGAGAIAGTVEVASGVKNKLANFIKDISPAKPPMSSGDKWLKNWAHMDRDPVGGTPSGAAAYQRSKSSGDVSKKIQKKFGPEFEKKALLNIEGYMREKKLLEELAGKEAGKEAMSKASKVLGKIPLGSTMAGYSSGMDIGEAAQRASKGDITGATIKGVSGLGTAATLIPHPAPRLLGGALALGSMPVEYVYQMMQENKRRKSQGLAPASRGQEEIKYDQMGNPIY